MDVGDSNDSAIKNHLDHKYLTDFEKLEIRKYKDIYYIGHKAHLRKVLANLLSIRRTLGISKIITSH